MLDYTLFPLLAPSFIINSPALFPPTKEMALIPGCWQMFLVVSNPP